MLTGEVREPRFASSQEAASLVRVVAQGNCSGVPLKGTFYVVTAAHCVLSSVTGKFTPEIRITVKYGENVYEVSRVLVQETHAPVDGEVYTQNDIAILVLTDRIPDIGVDLGNSADLADGGVMVAYQTLGNATTFYRPKENLDYWPPPSASYGATPAACEFTKRQARKTNNFWFIQCSMLPGASGGPVFSLKENGYHLVGILSSISHDLSFNGVTPISIVKELLDNQSLYTHDFRPGKVVLKGLPKSNSVNR